MARFITEVDKYKSNRRKKFLYYFGIAFFVLYFFITGFLAGYFLLLSNYFNSCYQRQLKQNFELDKTNHVLINKLKNHGWKIEELEEALSECEKILFEEE